MSLSVRYSREDPSTWGSCTNGAFWFFRDGRPRTVLARLHASHDPAGRGTFLAWTDSTGQISEASPETVLFSVRSALADLGACLPAGAWTVTIDVPSGMTQMYPMNEPALAQLEVPIAFELLRASGAVPALDAEGLVLTGDISGRYERYTQVVASTMEDLGYRCATSLGPAHEMREERGARRAR